MKQHTTAFKEMISRITSGELTRLQAADIYKVKPATLNAWIRRGKLDVPKQKRVAYGAAADLADNLDPQIAALLTEATQKVLDGTYKSCLAASKAYPDVVLGTLTTRVRKARLAQGLPIGRQGKKAPAEPPLKPMPRTPEQINARLGFDVELR